MVTGKYAYDRDPAHLHRLPSGARHYPLSLLVSFWRPSPLRNSHKQYRYIGYSTNHLLSFLLCAIARLISLQHLPSCIFFFHSSFISFLAPVNMCYAHSLPFPISCFFFFTHLRDNASGFTQIPSMSRCAEPPTFNNKNPFLDEKSNSLFFTNCGSAHKSAHLMDPHESVEETHWGKIFETTETSADRPQTFNRLFPKEPWTILRRILLITERVCKRGTITAACLRPGQLAIDSPFFTLRSESRIRTDKLNFGKTQTQSLSS